ncbi:hypothetical protein [Aureispira sp. CCB-E]|uniref:hypothetical protein n=1 Tax=Aureispira sp. CCB-E TaxID=3051121 RepID=UPI0028684230|nr:hypothetical protein [Aureispira sp. CCB-E]WMX16437.1 hypothetical protein QP953_08660 [Aureispira sp. CCB-E]
MFKVQIIYIVLICLAILGCNGIDNFKETIDVEDWHLETKSFLEKNCACDLKIKALFIDKVIELGIRDSLMKNVLVRQMLMEDNQIHILEKSNIGRNLYTGYFWSKKNNLHYMHFSLDSLKLKITSRDENPNELFSLSKGCTINENACDFFQAATIYSKVKLIDNTSILYDIRKISQQGWKP